ncbi:MAG: hypothetical protein JWR17_3401 [Pseudomonas sp.]|nr:hypothetical protein [Pseudomonas sp.]
MLSKVFKGFDNWQPLVGEEIIAPSFAVLQRRNVDNRIITAWSSIGPIPLQSNQPVSKFRLGTSCKRSPSQVISRNIPIPGRKIGDVESRCSHTRPEYVGLSDMAEGKSQKLLPTPPQMPNNLCRCPCRKLHTFSRPSFLLTGFRKKPTDG